MLFKVIPPLGYFKLLYISLFQVILGYSILSNFTLFLLFHSMLF
jgi:hypothetical protein